MSKRKLQSANLSLMEQETVTKSPSHVTQYPANAIGPTSLPHGMRGVGKGLRVLVIIGW
jgi:hypothetical protein